LLDLRDLRDLLDLRDLRYLRDLLDLRYLRYLRYLRDLNQKYEQKYKAILEQHQPEIHVWADKALAKLQSMSDEEILKYFPNSTEEDFREFRANYPPKIISELKMGNNEVLTNSYLTSQTLAETQMLIEKENPPGVFYQFLVTALQEKFEDEQLKSYKRRVVEWLIETKQLRLDEPTMKFLLQFDLYADYPERQETEMKAQRYLRSLDYARWRELLVPFTQMRIGDSTIWVNALYVFKNLN